MSAPTVFLSAATIDLREWRELLDHAFREAGFHVLTQDHSLGMPPRDVRDMLARRIDESDCIIHLAGMGYGSHAAEPFPKQPGFQCSWTQFEYYYAHQQERPVIAFVCAPELSKEGFVRADGLTEESEEKRLLQMAHRERVASGEFDRTPLMGKVRRTVNRPVKDMQALIVAVAGCVREVKELGPAGERVVARLQARVRLHQLPPDPRLHGFVGRREDLEKMLAQATSAVTAITGLKGMGGIGKTALSLVLAHDLAPRFPDGQLFIECRGTSPAPPRAEELLIRVIDLLQPGSARGLPEDLASLRGYYQTLLHGQRLLLVLDNAASTEQVKPLLPPAGCGLIVSSRHPLQLGKASLVHTVGRLLEAEAIALLREFHPGLLDADAKELTRLCAGLPLALKLAGSHLQLDGPEPDVAGYIKMLQRSRSRIGALDPEAADAGELTISETLRLSEDMLAPQDRNAWRALGVFTHSFEAEAAARVMQAGESDPDDGAKGARTRLAESGGSAPVQAGAAHQGDAGSPSRPEESVRAPVDAVARLAHFVRRSLLEKLPGGRYQMHDLAAEYAREKLGADTCTTLRLVHAGHYKEVGARSQAIYLKGKPMEGLALFDAERGGIEAAFEWLRGEGGPGLGQAGIAGRQASESDQALSEDEAGRAKGRHEASARLLMDLVGAVAYIGDLRFQPRQQRIPWLEAQLIAARHLGDRGAEGNALGNLGLGHADLGDARKAIEFYEQCLVLHREIGDRRGEGADLGNLGIAHADLGDARKAIEFYEQQLVIVREIGDRRGEGNALGNLGNAHLQLGDARKAIEFYEQALVIDREIGDRRGEGADLGNLGNAHADLGDARKAIAFYEQQLVIVREIGDRRGEGNALGNLGNAHADLGDARKAIEFYEQALVIVREIGDRRGEGVALGNLGNAHADLGDARKAIEFYELRLVIARETGDRRGEGIALGNLGIAHRRLGDARKAIEFYEQQLVIVRETGDRRGEGNALWNSALALDSLGERAAAIPRAQAALAIYEAIEDPYAAKVRATLTEWGVG